MFEPIFSPESTKRLKCIHQLSQTYNQKVQYPHMKRLLALMDEHVDEISELYHEGNTHFLTETGDLMVLCLEVLLENHASTDEILTKCFGRYENKLTSLLNELKNTPKAQFSD